MQIQAKRGSSCTFPWNTKQNKKQKKETNKQTSRQTYKQASKHANKQANEQTKNGRNKQTKQTNFTDWKIVIDFLSVDIIKCQGFIAYFRKQAR